MSYEEEKRCPLCAEEMDWTDQQLKPCKCGYQVCVWCWHQIMDMAEKNGMDGRCPACRAPYDKDKIVGMEAKFERVAACNAKKHKPPKAKAKANEGKKDLTNIRVIQRRMAYVIGLPLNLADEDLLQRKDFFGQYGKVTKVSLSRTAGGAIQQFVNDTCSVYITFSKEEEAIRCIQSVHGFVLEGRFLRASFGTAKYCHAWLRNMPCNNSACLYLHSMGAEEDSFGKDEAAAVQTRSRVQQIVGATHNMHRCSGNALPPPIDESFNCNGASAEKPISKGVSKDASPDNAFSSVQSTYFASSKDKDGDARATNKMTTFVDIVGRSCNYGTEKDGNVAEDRGVENLRSELSSVAYNKDNNVGTAHTNAMLCSNFSSSSLPANGYPNNREFKEPFREPSNLWAVGRVDPIPSDEFIEQSGTTVSTEKQMLQDPSSVVREDLLSSDNGGLKDCRSVSQVGTSLPPSCPLTTSEDPRVYAWQDGESYNLGDYNVDLNTVNDYAPSVTCTRSMNDLYNEKKFQSSAKSDRIYRCSNSFSNEEIVEHLRRLDDHDSTIEAQNPALEAVESSIISNIMSLDLDAGDDSLNWQPAVAGLFGQTDDQHGSSWSRYNNDQSGLSFTKQHGFVSQPGDLDSSFTDIGQDLKKSSTPRESGENRHYSFKSGHHGLTPPGFSLPSREPPPGFPSCERTDQGFLSNSGSTMIKTSSFSKTHYRTPSTGNSSNTSDIDINDPAIMVVGRGKPPNGLTNSCFDTRSTQASQPGAFDDKARLWLLMQQSNQDLKYPQTYMQQVPAANQDLRYSGQTGDVYSSWNNMYGISSGYLDQLHTYNPSSFTPFSQQKFTNGSLSNSYQPGLNEMHVRNDRSTAELQRNEKLGLNNCYPGYGDYMLQQGSNDRYTRVFGM